MIPAVHLNQVQFQLCKADDRDFCNGFQVQQARRCRDYLLSLGGHRGRSHSTRDMVWSLVITRAAICSISYRLTPFDRLCCGSFGEYEQGHSSWVAILPESHNYGDVAGWLPRYDLVLCLPNLSLYWPWFLATTHPSQVRTQDHLPRTNLRPWLIAAKLHHDDRLYDCCWCLWWRWSQQHTE